MSLFGLASPRSGDALLRVAVPLRLVDLVETQMAQAHAQRTGCVLETPQRLDLAGAREDVAVESVTQL
jgi:hypothetical protein